jgi:hypothetical protein
MASLEKSPIPDEEEPAFIIQSTEDSEGEKGHIHFVPRSDALLDDTISNDAITGYNPILMRARATLSSENEKKVIRKMDWRLIPLLSVIYMIKSIDATNVRSSGPKHICL